MSDYPFHQLADDLKAAAAIPDHQPQLARLADQAAAVRSLEARRDAQAATYAGTFAELAVARADLEHKIADARRAGAKLPAILECGVSRITVFRALGRAYDDEERAS